MKDINITINGNEKNKNEIIYNNIIGAMETMDLTKDEQIDYLKNKIATFESDLKNKHVITITIICGLLLLIFGLYLIIKTNIILGIIIVLISFILTITKLLLIIRKMTNDKNNKYDKIEYLRNILDKKLK